MVRAVVGPILALFVSGALSGQSFEVASIKPAPPPGSGPMRVGSSGGPGTRDPGRFNCENCSLSNLVTQAYDIRSYQLSAPSWLATERFIILATVPEGATKEQFHVMLQNMLKERFGLTFHREQKEMQMRQWSNLPACCRASSASL